VKGSIRWGKEKRRCVCCGCALSPRSSPGCEPKTGNIAAAARTTQKRCETEYALALTAGVAVYCCAPHSRRCNHAVALQGAAEAYGWVQHAVTRQCSHVPGESFSRHSHAHHAVLAVPPLQLYRHNIAWREKSEGDAALHFSLDPNRDILKGP
jgi:hypothetical protein